MILILIIKTFINKNKNEILKNLSPRRKKKIN